MQRHEGRTGQKHSTPPSPQPAGSAPGRAATRSTLACAFSASPVAASRCAGRSRQPLPPFGRDATAPAPSPKGPSHPSQKATVPRPLHLGPICCCWLPSLPPALNSDVFKHTHQRHRAAPGEPPARSTFPSISRKRGASELRRRGENRSVPCLLPTWLGRSGKGDGGGSRGTFTPLSLFSGILAMAGEPPNIPRVGAVPPGTTSTVMGSPQKRLGEGGEEEMEESLQICRFGVVFSIIFSKNSHESLQQTPSHGPPALGPGHGTNRDTGSHWSHRLKRQGRGHG